MRLVFMSAPNDKSKFTGVPGFYNDVKEYTTIKMERWHYCGDRGRLRIIKLYGDEKKFNAEVDKCNDADENAAEGLPHDKCPMHFWLEARPKDLINLAKEILDFYKE
jgi:hypothetical protein